MKNLAADLGLKTAQLAAAVLLVVFLVRLDVFLTHLRFSL